MYNERQKNIAILRKFMEGMEPGNYKSAVGYAYNKLIAEEIAANAGMRTPDEWPVCRECGRYYMALPTRDSCVRELKPACKCATNGEDPVFRNRPEESKVWQYIKDKATTEVTPWGLLSTFVSKSRT